jgi:hypothetical protein
VAVLVASVMAALVVVARRRGRRIERSIFVGLLVGVAVTGCGGSTPVSHKASAGALSAQRRETIEQCERGAAHRTNLGIPVIFAKRRSLTGVLFVDRRDNYFRLCVTGGSSVSPSSGEWPGLGRSTALDGAIHPRPGPNSIGDPGGVGACNQQTGNAMTVEGGPVGNGVVGVTFAIPAQNYWGPPAQTLLPAIVKDGFYADWWPLFTDAGEVSVTTKSGQMITTTDLPGDSGPC